MHASLAVIVYTVNKIKRFGLAGPQCPMHAARMQVLLQLITLLTESNVLVWQDHSAPCMQHNLT